MDSFSSRWLETSGSESVLQEKTFDIDTLTQWKMVDDLVDTSKDRLYNLPHPRDG